jgi:hypothetical protein
VGIGTEQLRIGPKSPCRVATVGSNISLSAAPNTLDGVSLSQFDRVLVKDQTLPAQNGIYVVATLGSGANGVWTRARDFNSSLTALPGSDVRIAAGSINAGKVYYLTTGGTIVVGTTALTFTEQSGGSSAYTAPNEYYVDPGEATNASLRQYQTIAGALAAATLAANYPALVRLAPGPHTWAGTSLSASGDTVIWSQDGSTIQWASGATLSTDGSLVLDGVTLDGSTGGTEASGTATVVTAPLAVGDAIQVGSIYLVGVAGARTPGSDDFNASLTPASALATEIAAALNDPANTQAGISAVAVGAVVTITASSPGTAGNSIDLVPSTTPPGGITVSGATLSGGLDAAVTIEVRDLRLVGCSGELLAVAADAPSPGAPVWKIERSSLSLRVSGSASGASSGSLEVVHSVLRNSLSNAVWDHSAGTTAWAIEIKQTLLDVTEQSPAPSPSDLFVSNASDHLSVKFVDSLLRLNVSNTPTIMSGGSGSAGAVWQASSIVVQPDEGGGGFAFGDTGQALILEISAVSAPVPAPASAVYNATFGGAYFVSDGAGGGWWRYHSNVVVLGGSFGAGSPTTLTDLIDPTRTVVEFATPSLVRIVRIVGTVLVSTSLTGAPSSAAFFVDALLRVDSVGGTSFLSGGGAQTPAWEDNVGEYLCSLVADTGAVNGFHVVMTKAFGSNNPDIRAKFDLIESYPF